jgi:hypothetical protein
MAEQETAVLKDRSSWLIFFGVVELIFGGISALYIPLMVFSMRFAGQGELSGAPAFPLRTLVPVLILYGLLAVFWVMMGIGSIKATRWARALTLIAAWFWLIIGVISILAILYNIPNMTRMMKESGGKMPDTFILGIIIFQIVFMSILFIVLPVIFILFYGSPGVKATVERRDPKVRWTDRGPLPVLAFCLCQVFGAVQMVSTISMGIGFPVFGKFLEGPSMVVITLGISIVFLYLAWNIYHLRMVGWWGSLGIMILGMVSSFVSFSKRDLMDLYIRMGYQGKQLEMMKKMQIWTSSQMQWGIVITAILWLGFLLYLRRYFKPKQFGANNG